MPLQTGQMPRATPSQNRAAAPRPPPETTTSISCSCPLSSLFLYSSSPLSQTLRNSLCCEQLFIRCWLDARALYFVSGSLHLFYLTLRGVPKAMVPRAHFRAQTRILVILVSAPNACNMLKIMVLEYRTLSPQFSPVFPCPSCGKPDPPYRGPTPHSTNQGGRLSPPASFILLALGVTCIARTARRVPFGRRLGSSSSSFLPRVRQGEFLWCSPGIRQFLFLRNSDSE
jgi:hypothetical protein